MQSFDIRADVLTRNSLPDATWIETGTYRGETTRLLSQLARVVYSIEPGPQLFCEALLQFRNDANVKLINGLSEQVLPELLPTLDGDICFWLDGHYTDETTHKGPQDTPILDELACIAANLCRMSGVVVMVDDIHLFNGKTHVYGAYPPIETIMDWSLDHNLLWHTEHDILIARN